MKELNQYELENVSGGILPWVIFAAVTFYGGYEAGRRSR